MIMKICYFQRLKDMSCDDMSIDLFMLCPQNILQQNICSIELSIYFLKGTGKANCRYGGRTQMSRTVALTARAEEAERKERGQQQTGFAQTSRHSHMTSY